MFCKSCGKQIGDNERFCPHCGAAVGAPQQAAYQQAPQQAYQYRAPAAPAGNKNVLALVVSIVFGVAAVFGLIALIGFCVKLSSHAGMIISFVFAILACIGIALAPLFKEYKKVCITACSALLFLGMYGISMIGIASSFGYFIYMLGFAAFALTMWFFYTKNSLADKLWFIAPAVIFLGALLTWIIAKYFTMMKYAVVYYLFDLLFAIVIVGGAVVLSLYMISIKNEKEAKVSMPNPGAKAPQPPYQGR